MNGGYPAEGWSPEEIRAAARWAFEHAKNLMALLEADDLSRVREAATQAARRCAGSADRAAGALALLRRPPSSHH